MTKPNFLNINRNARSNKIYSHTTCVNSQGTFFPPVTPRHNPLNWGFSPGNAWRTFADCPPSPPGSHRPQSSFGSCCTTLPVAAALLDLFHTAAPAHLGSDSASESYSVRKPSACPVKYSKSRVRECSMCHTMTHISASEEKWFNIKMRGAEEEYSFWVCYQ